MATKCSDPAVLAGLFLAAYSGDLVEVKSTLKNNALSADVVDPNQGSTALLWASAGGSLEVVEWLVKQGGANAGHRNKDDRTAFFFACEHCHKPVASFLVEQAGVDVNAKDRPSGHTPLHRACIAGQSRSKAGATDLISWLLSSTKADVNATDLGGRLPGNADLSVETPSFKPTAQAAAITKTLEDARSGGVPPTAASAAAAPAEAAADPSPNAKVSASRTRLLPKPAELASRRPTMTLASARAAAGRTSSPTSPSSAGFSRAASPDPKASAPAASRAAASPSRVALRAAALAEKAKAIGSGATTPAVRPSSVSSPTKPEATTAAEDPSSCSSAPAVASATTRSSAPRASTPSLKAAASPSLKAAAISPSLEASSPPSSGSPSWASKLSPRAGGVLPRDGGGLPPAAASSSNGPSSPAASVEGVAPGLVKQSSYLLRTASAASGGSNGSSSPGPVKQSSYKLRNASAASGGGSNGTSRSASPGLVRKSSFLLRDASGASSSNGIGSAPPASHHASAAATAIKPGLVRQNSYLLRTGKAPPASNGNGSSPSFSAAPSATSSRYQPSAQSSTAPAAAATKSAPAPARSSTAAAVAAADVNGTKSRSRTSALAAAFETMASAKGDPASAPKAAGGPEPVVSSSAANGGCGPSGGRPTTKAPSAQRSPRSSKQQASPRRFTPGSPLGKGAVGTVLQRKNVYVAAASKSANGAAAPPLGRGRKEKDGSFMDKFVSMFTISPHSSPSSSPRRSSSRSPPPSSRSPMTAKFANGTASPAGNNAFSPAAGPGPRMGFFNTNKSFKVSAPSDEIENANEKE